MLPTCSVSQRSERMLQKKDIRHVSPGRHVSVILGGIVLAIITTLWISGIVAVHGHGNPADIITSEETGVAVEKTEALPDRLGRLRAFPRWKVTRNGRIAGYIYTFSLNTPSSSMLNRLLLAPRSMEFAVYLDNQYTIQAMRQLNPYWPQSAAAFTAQYAGMNLYQVLGADDQHAFAAGGALAGPGRQLMRTLLGSVYVADFGEYAFNRLVAERNLQGLQLVEPFPAFRAVSTAGRELDTASLSGRYTAIVFTDPVCGSCYDAAMELLTILKTRTSDWNVIAVVFGEAGIAPVNRFVNEASEQGAQIIIDPKNAVGEQMGHTDAPYAVLLDKNVNVLYSGSALKQNSASSDDAPEQTSVYTVLENVLKGLQ
jgi:hypothetical protein